MCRLADAVARATVAILDAVLVGCFLSCFRPRHARRDPPVPKDQLGEAQALPSDCDRGFGVDGGGSQGNSASDAGTDEELRQQANYLTLCGTIYETPVELRKMPFHCEINMENTDECDNMPTDEFAVKEDSSYEGFKCEEDCTLRPELNAEDTEHLALVEPVPQSAFRENSRFQGIKNRLSDCTNSPFPTPLVLRDEDQTPVTICTPRRGGSISGKRVRTLKQFVYPVLRPIENKLHLMKQTEDSSPLLLSNAPKRRNLGTYFIKKPQKTSSKLMDKPGLSNSLPFSVPSGNDSCHEKGTLCLDELKIGSPDLLDGAELSKSSSDERHAVLSLSHWLKPSSADDGNQGNIKSPDGNQLSDEGSLMGSEMNWGLESPTPRLPKLWNGNGIPNTTTKYKEDQQVSWHTTPFEERLMKVLSDENPCSPRKVVRGMLFNLEGKNV